nr:MAG TPA: Molybdopterin synthase catalytic subunit [Bacteriophage sp.]
MRLLLNNDHLGGVNEPVKGGDPIGVIHPHSED